MTKWAKTLIVLTCLVTPLFAQAPAAASAETRAELQRFADLLDLAVRKVSRPAPFQVLGQGTGSRGYFVPGYGAVFTLLPRALPAPRSVIVMRRRSRDDEAQIGIKIRELGPKPPAADPGPAAAPPEPAPRAFDREIERIEEQVEMYQREAERASREAERALERVEREIRVRFPEPETPDAPAPPQVPEPPLPPTPPWRFWFQAVEDEDSRTPDVIVAAVRSALAQALEAHGPSLRLLRPEQVLAVAVDFTGRAFPLSPDRVRGERTLVLTVRKRDLDERQSGRLQGPELLKRMEFAEY